MKKALLPLLLVFTSALPSALHAYGAVGHSLVGAIAQAKLQQTKSGQAAATKALALLADPTDKDPTHTSLSLMQAGPVPDELRTWDDLLRQTTPDQILAKWPLVTNVPALPPNKYNATGLVGATWPNALRQQMWEYFCGNCAPVDGGQARHHVFHFCDLPVAPGLNLDYAPTKPGCGPLDIVHMIDYCRAVLANKSTSVAAPGPNVTKAVALIVLVHLLGDLHQPLHVGAEYFDANGNPTDPAKNPNAIADQGGNLIRFYSPKNLHGHWDTDFVTAAVTSWNQSLKISNTTDLTELAQKLAKQGVTPALKFPAGADTMALATQWAGESARLSQEAHTRLKFSNFKAPAPKQFTPFITATPATTEAEYFAWAAEQTQQQIVRAGLRLAWLIEHAVH